jgi:hypothetical protein
VAAAMDVAMDGGGAEGGDDGFWQDFGTAPASRSKSAARRARSRQRKGAGGGGDVAMGDGDFKAAGGPRTGSAAASSSSSAAGGGFGFAFALNAAVLAAENSRARPIAMLTDGPQPNGPNGPANGSGAGASAERKGQPPAGQREAADEQPKGARRHADSTRMNRGAHAHVHHCSLLTVRSLSVACVCAVRMCVYRSDGLSGRSVERA